MPTAVTTRGYRMNGKPVHDGRKCGCRGHDVFSHSGDAICLLRLAHEPMDGAYGYQGQGHRQGGCSVDRKFDPEKLEHLNDPGRLEILVPRLLWEALGSPVAGNIVEVGAGTGLVAAELLAFAPELTVVAVDVEPMMFEWMMERRPEVAQGRMVPLLADEIHIPLPDASFDGVYTVSLHHELHEPLASCKEALRILRPGAPMLVVDWDARHMAKGPPLDIRVPAEEIAATLEAAGFESIQLHDGLPYHAVISASRPEE